MSQQTLVLLSLSHLGFSLLCWLSALAGLITDPWTQLGSGSAVLMALFAGACGVALRTSAPASESEIPDWLAHFGSSAEERDFNLFLIGATTTCNWCGMLLQTSSSFFDAIPTLLTLLFFEVLAWNGLGEPSTTSSRPLELTEDENQPQIVRSMQDMADEHGVRMLEGCVQLPFEPEQRLAEFVVAFCPPFASQPSVEYEPSDADFDVRLGRLSPQGAQFLVRRQNLETNQVEVAWFACEGEDQALTSEILP